MATSMRPYLLVAAIDFGTTYSGYAFSFQHEYTEDPCKISANTWNAGSRGLMSLKAPTCALFDPKKKFHSFGYEAEEKYANLAADGAAHGWYYFRRFKMTLFDKMSLKRNFDVEADGGKTLPAMTVFSSCIKYLVDHLFKTCEDRVSGVERTDIRWVLTVPAIWNDSAKQFMREAAEKAEIPGDQLLMALEPEAASIFCQHLPIQMLSGTEGGFKPFQLGSKYLVLDAGGGTIDITVHEVMEDKELRELHRANGGDWGGTKVDKAFTDLLTDIVGNDVMKEVDMKDKSDLMDLFREFEVKKRNFKPDMEGKISMKVPIALAEICKAKRGTEIKDIIASTEKYKNRISWIGDKLRIEPDVATDFFQESCNAIVEHLESLFNEPEVQDVPTILMVGGYSESPILQDFVKTKFKQKKIIIPSDPGLAVLKGAVIFGHNPYSIAERICRYTYGMNTLVPFIHDIHPLEKLYITDKDEEKCLDIFLKFAEIGDPVRTDVPQYEGTHYPANYEQDGVTFSIYASTDRDPTYVTDESCIHLGTLNIDLQETVGNDRPISVQISLSGTEIEVEAKEKNTGMAVFAKFEFLD
ncbi:hypothetical protein CHS0354_027316 [Potamilus streckersoni]|uniref:Uncharacterized protein n=1 Tax=Potamilus streckersoni TaxID=2493646 RepID=A0AAE0VQD2_9BIVA|nr:hypothetical protein CHS0354_027316 [Potamilus streckersoni]